MGGTAQTPQARVVVVMGVSGAGKTTVGRGLAARLGWQFADGDDFHSADNVAKMAQGKPLEECDRTPWLQSLRQFIQQQIAVSQPTVLACSALKADYRHRLQVGPQVQFAYLTGDPELIRQRLIQRKGHYMKAALLKSQFASLEVPETALVIDVDQPPEAIVDEIIAALSVG
jgi:gluconokinase